MIQPNTTLQNSVDGCTVTAVADTTTTEIIAAVGANIAVHLEVICVTNGSDTQGTNIEVYNGATLRWSSFASLGGGGYAISFPTCLKGAANSNWSIKCGTAGASVTASMAGFKSNIY